MTEDTTLRDKLAKDRTVLANEQTLLAYARTSVALLALAVFVFKFAPTAMGITIGVFSLVGTGGVMLLGWRNYRSISNRISSSPDAGHRGVDEQAHSAGVSPFSISTTKSSSAWSAAASATSIS